MNSNFYLDTNNLRMGVPFSKVDGERRIVSGLATADNIDSHGDRITFDASLKAFDTFRGNIREMHGENAVGKLVNFEEKSFMCDDPDCTEVHKGIWVDVYVSKAAEDVWTKIQEGIFGGFSIGGKINEKSAYEDDDRKHKGFVITDYDLFELSIVDNPANPLTNVKAFSKSAGGGLVGDVDVLNVYQKGNTILLSREIEKDGFENLGWIENTDDEIAKAIDQYDSNTTLQNRIEELLKTLETPTVDSEVVEFDDEVEKAIADEGGVKMADEIVETAEVVEEVSEDVMEVTEDVEKDVEPDVAAFDPDDFMAKFSEKFDAMSEAVTKAVDEVKDSFTGELADVKKELDAMKEKLSDVDGRVSSVEDTTATKKSVDAPREDVEVEADMEDEDDNLWRGTIFNLSDIVK